MNVWRRRGALFLAALITATGLSALFVSTPASAAPITNPSCSWVHAELIRCSGIEMRSPGGRNEFSGADKEGNYYTLTGINAAYSAGRFGLQTAGGNELKSTVLNNTAAQKITKAQFESGTGTTPVTCTAPGGTGTTGGSNCGTGGAGSTTTGANAAAAAGADNAAACDVGSLTWILCPIIGIVGGAVDTLKDMVLDQLQYRLLFAPGTQAGSGVSVEASWKVFRDFTNALFVLIFIVMIFGTALGMDNYSIKKILPRLIAAAVLIQLSYLITAFAVTASNVTGFGMAQLFSTASTGGNATANMPMFEIIGAFLGIGGLSAAGVATIALAPGLIVPFVLFLAGLLISLLTVFFTLQLRIILLTIFIVIAPLAILLWTLPNTERYFQIWRKWFVRLLLMYPMIGALFAGGNLVSDITIEAQNATANAVMPHIAAISGISSLHLAAVPEGMQATWAKMIASLIPIIVFFMVPSTFKFAGGLMSLGSNMISRMGKRGQNGLQNSAWRKRFDEGNKSRALKGLQNMPDTGGGFGAGAKRALLRKQAGFGMMPPSEATKHAIRAATNKDAALKIENAAHEQFQEANGGKQNFDDMVDRGTATKRDDMVKQEAALITASQWKGQDQNSANKSRAFDIANNMDNSEPQRIAAMQFLAQSDGGRDKLREVKKTLMANGGGQMTEGDVKTWRMALGDNSKISSAAPDLLKGDSAFNGVTPAEMADWDEGTTKRAVEHWNAIGKTNAADSGKYQQLRSHAGPLLESDQKFVDQYESNEATLGQANSAIAGIMEAPTLKGKFEPKAAAALYGGKDFLTENTSNTLASNFTSDGSRVVINRKQEDAKARISSVLEEHVQYEASQGRTTSVEELQNQYFNGNDASFKLRVDKAASSHTPISQIDGGTVTLPSTNSVAGSTSGPSGPTPSLIVPGMSTAASAAAAPIQVETAKASKVTLAGSAPTVEAVSTAGTGASSFSEATRSSILNAPQISASDLRNAPTQKIDVVTPTSSAKSSTSYEFASDQPKVASIGVASGATFSPISIPSVQVTESPSRPATFDSAAVKDALSSEYPGTRSVASGASSVTIAQSATGRTSAVVSSAPPTEVVATVAPSAQGNAEPQVIQLPETEVLSKASSTSVRTVEAPAAFDPASTSPASVTVSANEIRETIGGSGSSTPRVESPAPAYATVSAGSQQAPAASRVVGLDSGRSTVVVNAPQASVQPESRTAPAVNVEVSERSASSARPDTEPATTYNSVQNIRESFSSATQSSQPTQVEATVIAPQGNIPAASSQPATMPSSQPAEVKFDPNSQAALDRALSGYDWQKSQVSDLVYPKTTESKQPAETTTKTGISGSTFKVTDRRHPAISARLAHSDADGNPEPGDDRSIQ